MKYKLLNKDCVDIKGITIDESAKEDFKDLMGWDEWAWNKFTKLIKTMKYE